MLQGFLLHSSSFLFSFSSPLVFIPLFSSSFPLSLHLSPLLSCPSPPTLLFPVVSLPLSLLHLSLHSLSSSQPSYPLLPSQSFPRVPLNKLLHDVISLMHFLPQDLKLVVLFIISRFLLAAFFPLSIALPMYLSVSCCLCTSLSFFC